MSDINNCPMCKKPVLANGFVSCQNKDCTEHDIKYLYHEFLELLSDLAALELLEEDHINAKEVS